MTDGGGGGGAISVGADALAGVLGHHGIAAALLRDGALVWANDCLRATVAEPGAVETPDVLDERLRAVLTMRDLPTELAVGVVGVVGVELSTNRALLQRAGTVTGVDGADGAGVLVTFPVEAGPSSDPAYMARLEAMLDTTTDIISVIDREGRIRYSNAAAGRLTGLAGFEANGASFAELVHPDDVDSVMSAFGDLLADKAVDPMEFRLRFADGHWHNVEAVVADQVTVEGGQGWVVTVRDITDRVRRHDEQAQARRELEALVENLEDVIVVLDADLGVTWASPGIERLVDAPAYTNVGEHALNDIHPDDVVGVIETLERVSADSAGRGRIEFRLRHARRGWRWVEAAVVNRLEDVAINGLVCTLRDITERRDVDAELRRLHDQDRAEVERLRETDQLKDHFLATVSHELRTPLSAVRGFSAILERQGDKLDDAAKVEMAGRIHANARDMEQMIEQLLELSRLQAGRVHLAANPVDLDVAVPSLLGRIDHKLGDHDVHVGPLADTVLADERAFDHVVRNLVLNAIRYSDVGSRVEIWSEKVDGEVALHVRDQGIGIELDEQAKVFQSFYQVAPAASGRRGTGIGLNIARRYAQLQSGRLSLESEPGVGSTFTFWLPAHVEPI